MFKVPCRPILSECDCELTEESVDFQALKSQPFNIEIDEVEIPELGCYGKTWYCEFPGLFLTGSYDHDNTIEKINAVILQALDKLTELSAADEDIEHVPTQRNAETDSSFKCGC